MADQLFAQCKIQISFKPIHEWAKTLQPDAKISGQNDFARIILPDELYRIHGSCVAYRSRVFNPVELSAPRYAMAQDYLLGISESEIPITFETHPECLALINNWIHLFQVCEIPPQELPNLVRQLLNQCIVSGSGSSTLADRIRHRIEYLLSKSDPAGLDAATGESEEADSPFAGCAQALATMSLIACTLFCWNELPDLGPNCTEPKKNSRLYDLILPSTSSGHYIETLTHAKEQIGGSKMFKLSQQANQKLLQELSRIAESNCEDWIRGWAYYLLHLAYQLGSDSGKSLECLKKSAEQGYYEACRKQEQNSSDKEAIKLFAEAESLYNTNDQTKIRQVYNMCKDLLALQPEPSDNALIGRAALLIYYCSTTKADLLPKGETPEQYLKKSRDCGNETAQELCEDHLGIIPRQLDPDDGTEGTYYFNCCNSLTKQIQASAPKGWMLAEWNSNADHSIRLNHADTEKNVRCYFLDDDQMVNLHDVLCLLESLQEAQVKGYYESPEIYLRGQTEFLRPLIDTAVSRMAGRIVPLYIIDDDLWPVQWLLARHPLFYPIRSLPATSPATLNLVVVGNTRCAEWIVREAFALLGFINGNIKCEITVIAPHAEELEKSLYFKCPGMSDDVEIKNLSRPKLTFLSCEDSFQSNKIEQLLTDCYRQQVASCYYVIDTGDDANNLSLASRLREMLIRAVLSGKTGPHDEQKNRLTTPPPIAFRCRNPFTAHLSKQLVTEMENYGNQWYNSPCLIPFGSDIDRYTWQDIAGSFYEDVAKNIHLQYSFVDLPRYLSEDKRNKIIQESLSDYFHRSYNRESSLSVAISLPYRLFQFEAGSTRLIPPCWQITDSNAYCSEIQLNALGCLLNDCLETQADRVAVWEHDRWSRWMLSRGWKPESFAQSVECYTYGNKRPQLFIARLHPCICAYDDLNVLATDWKVATGMDKDFTSFDQKAIQKTLDILNLEWYKKESSIKKEHNEEKERG